MPGTKQLNPFAHAFEPPSGPALAPPTNRLAALRLGGVAIPVSERAAAADRSAPVPDAGFALWSGCASHRLTGAVRQSHQDEVAEEGDLELEPHFQEEDYEERGGSEARPASTCSSAEASPHASVRCWGAGDCVLGGCWSGVWAPGQQGCSGQCCSGGNAMSRLLQLRLACLRCLTSWLCWETPNHPGSCLFQLSPAFPPSLTCQPTHPLPVVCGPLAAALPRQGLPRRPD